MKTLGRILIILMVFAAVIGITYIVVNAGSSSTSANMPAFERGDEGRQRPEGGQLQFSNGERPEFPGGGPEFGREGPRGGGWIFGLIKNIGIIGIIVALIAVPRSLIRRKPAPAPVE